MVVGFGVFEVLCQFVHLAAGDEFVVVALLRRHPVAEEDVDLVLLQFGEDDRHGQGLVFRFVVQAVEQEVGDVVGHGDVAPVGVTELDRAVGCIFGLDIVGVGERGGE